MIQVKPVRNTLLSFHVPAISKHLKITMVFYDLSLVKLIHFSIFFQKIPANFTYFGKQKNTLVLKVNFNWPKLLHKTSFLTPLKCIFQNTKFTISSGNKYCWSEQTLNLPLIIETINTIQKAKICYFHYNTELATLKLCYLPWQSHDTIL